MEEIEVIDPAVEQAKSEGINVEGSYPADTVFVRAFKGDFDAVVTMYHDQGQIAMKLMGFDKGVTVQGGLPVPIATPAHGTAYDIAGEGVANPEAARRAFSLACEMGRVRRAALFGVRSQRQRQGLGLLSAPHADADGLTRAHLAERFGQVRRRGDLTAATQAHDLVAFAQARFHRGTTLDEAGDLDALTLVQDLDAQERATGGLAGGATTQRLRLLFDGLDEDRLFLRLLLRGLGHPLELTVRRTLAQHDLDHHLLQETRFV